jgi:hypothetical protein
MLRITKDQMIAMEQHQLLRLKNEILKSLCAKFPTQTKLGENGLEEFARCAMESARATWIDDAKQIQRFVDALFILGYILKDEIKLQYFTQVMMSEENAEARLHFVENNLLKNDGEYPSH